MASNPLRIPRPKNDQTLLEGRFRLVHQPSLELVDFGGVNLRLTGTYLWLSEELAIPLALIERTEVVEKGWFFKRTALQIVYRNPITGGSESAAFARLDWLGIGIYRREPLYKVREVIEKLVAAQEPLEPGRVAPAVQEPPISESVSLRCEGCGAQPAFYVSYVFLISVLFMYFKSEERRRLHCRSCIWKHGLMGYVLTAAGGWWGLGIVMFPFILFQTARNLRPVIGGAWYMLFAVPLLSVAGLITWLVMTWV